MTRKGRAITLSVSDRQKAQLEAIALAFDVKWGNNPNISQLIKDIADNKLRIAANNDWGRDRIDALNQARNALVDLGQVEAALAIARLLLDRSEISAPLHSEIEQFVESPAPPWRLQVDQFIHRQQPFQLAYQDAAERVFRFTVRYAEIARHDERLYLDCWCDETEGNHDLPELTHNWTLRLDRISADAAIAPMSGKWHSGLSSIPVELHLLHGLAFAYRTKTDADVVNEWHPNLPQTRRVVRQVSNTFWFFREVLRYGEDCEVISPKSVREHMKRKVSALAEMYQL